MKVQDLKQSVDLQRKQLNDCRAEITALKMHIEGARASRGWTVGESENTKTSYSGNSKEENKSSCSEPEELKNVDSTSRIPEATIFVSKDAQTEEKVVEINQVAVVSNSVESTSTKSDENGNVKHYVTDSTIVSCNNIVEYQDDAYNLISDSQSQNDVSNQNPGSLKRERTAEKMVILGNTCLYGASITSFHFVEGLFIKGDFFLARQWRPSKFFQMRYLRLFLTF